VTRLEQRLGANDGKVYLNHRAERIWVGYALGLVHRQ
jgi:hypothetical protein